jgi:hypothetical protein
VSGEDVVEGLHKDVGGTVTALGIGESLPVSRWVCPLNDCPEFIERMQHLVFPLVGTRIEGGKCQAEGTSLSHVPTAIGIPAITDLHQGGFVMDP